MNVYDEVILTVSLISLAIGLFGVYIYFGYKIKKLEDTVDNLYSYFIAALEPQIKRIREVVNNEIINKKEDASINNPDWMYSIFDKDKIKAYKERRTKEAEESKGPFKIGDRVRFKTMGGWYNSGIIKNMDEDSCLIEINKVTDPSLEPGYIVPLPYYVRVQSCNLISEKEVEE